MTVKKWLLQNTRRLDGKTVAITGSTGGLGLALSAHLLRLGASLLLLDRNEARSQENRKRLLDIAPDASVRTLRLDLADIENVRRVTEELVSSPPDIFIHNAGAYSIPRYTCVTGYDNVYQINFASPYYVIRTLLPALRARGGHVMVVGSIAHRYGKLDESDVDYHTRTAASSVYGNAKRTLMLALYALFREETEATLTVTHPGITATGITAHYPKIVFALIKYPMKVIFMRPRRAVLSLLSGVLTPCGEDEWIGPRLFDIWGLPKRSRLSFEAREKDAIPRIADEVYLRCANSK